jgi:hypothetical protein
VPENTAPLPDFTRWPSFPFEGDMRIKRLAAPVAAEPPRSGEDASDCVACNTPDDAYIWVSERWRVRAMDRPTGLPMVLILECRSHLDLGDLPNLLAAELGVMTVRLERAIRSLDGVARVHVNRWGDGSAHLHMWFLARPYGRLQLRGTFLSLWDDILPVIPEQQWRENLALVAAWLAEFGGNANAEPPHIQWQSPSRIVDEPVASAPEELDDRPTSLGDIEGSKADSESDDPMIADVETQDLAGSWERADALRAQLIGAQDQGAEHSGTQEAGDSDAGAAADPQTDGHGDRGATDGVGQPVLITQRNDDEAAAVPRPFEAEPGDAAPRDTESGDTGPGDTGPGDTGPGDLAPGDLAPGDLAPGDLAPGDLTPEGKRETEPSVHP